MQSIQAVFDACNEALLKRQAFPEPSDLASGNLIIAEFRTLRDTMNPRVWKTEVQDMAADYELDFNAEFWELHDILRKAQYA